MVHEIIFYTHTHTVHDAKRRSRGNIIRGRFHHQELTKTAAPDVFQAERIIRRKRDYVLNKWLGLPYLPRIVG